MSTTVAVPTHLWERITVELDRDEESAGVLLAAPVRDEQRTVLLARDYLPVAEENYLRREPLRLALSSAAWMRAVGVAARDDLQAVFVHTHPGGDATPSYADDLVNSALAPVFQRRLKTGEYASLIVGGTRENPSFTGRLASDGMKDVRALHCVRVVGPRLQLLTAQGVVETDPPPTGIYDRQVLAFGAVGQATLKTLRVGVVGAGGTGSAVAEQLIRLGVGELVIVDDDRVTATNVTRIYGSTMDDVGELKVDVAARNATRIGLGTSVAPVVAKVSERAGVLALRTCDAVFGCTDDNLGRIVLSRLAYWYCLPVIDMGVLIRAPQGRVTHLDGRITVMAPGEPCLVCRQRVDMVRAREESLSRDEREQLALEGYASGLDEPDPSVVAYTSAVASHAVAVLLQRLFGFGLEPFPGELLVRFDRHELRALGAPTGGQHLCVDEAQWCRGDEQTLLGMALA
jgi:proteasome lid subunit RPN8/RPN11